MKRQELLETGMPVWMQALPGVWLIIINYRMLAAPSVPSSKHSQVSNFPENLSTGGCRCTRWLGATGVEEQW